LRRNSSSSDTACRRGDATSGAQCPQRSCPDATRLWQRGSRRVASIGVAQQRRDSA
jgi:hypothetical protein